MILQALNELYGRLASDPAYAIAPPGFSPQKISFCVVINPDGSLFAIEDARIKNEKGKLEAKHQEVPAHEKRTSGTKAQFMCDKLEYALGYQSKGKTEGIGEKCFEAFKAKHIAFENEINSPNYSAFCAFLKNWNPSFLENYDIGKDLESGFGIFQICGERRAIHDDDRVKEWWRSQQNDITDDRLEKQCLVSGELAPICRIHPDIKGFKSSIALVGIQEKTSYESYGKSKTDNCPISESVAFRYATALNALLAGPKKKKHRLNIGNTTAVFWTDAPNTVEDYFAEFFSTGSIAREEVQDETQRHQIELLLKAIRGGGDYQYRNDLNSAFYILGLEQPNPGRFSIRFFHRSTVADLIKHLNSHYQCLDMINNAKKDFEFPSVSRLLDQLVPLKSGKPDRDKIPPLLGGALTRAIVEGSPYPEGLFTAVIRRIHADRSIHYLRAAIIKAVLFRNHKIQIPIMLDKKNTNPAYLLGRLFSALEKTQEDAQPGINATIRDRFYSSASATPASVFPRLLRTYQHHLPKLNGGAKVNREKLVQEILSSIDSAGFPSQLNLQAQGIFAIGYYHQRKDFFTSKEDKQDNA